MTMKTQALVGFLTLGLASVVATGAAPAPAPDPASSPAAATNPTAATLQAQMEGLDYVIDPTVAAGTLSVATDGTITQTIGSMKLVLRQDGTWTIDPVAKAGGGKVTTAAYVSGCTGYFSDPAKINSKLENGAEQTCTTGAYPHSFKYQLRSTCADWYCVIFVDETEKLTSVGGGYTRVASLFRSFPCESTTSRQYQQTVWPSARGTEYGPVINTDEPTVACDISA